MLLPCNANFWGIRHAFGVIDTDSVPLPGIYPVIILSAEMLFCQLPWLLPIITMAMR